MHAATLDYQPPPGAMRRPHWDDKAMIDVFDHLPSNEPQARSAFDGAMAHLTALPRGKAEYGLIHQDAHAGNFFVTDEGAITLFDFDDCCYSWFANDIAIVIFYAMSWTNFENQDRYAERFWNHFIRGYSAEHAISDEWLAEIPWFLKLREIDTYAIIHRSMDVNNIADPWARRFMAGRRERINEGIPYLEMDFAHPRPGTP